MDRSRGTKSTACPPSLVFPFRPATLKVEEEAKRPQIMLQTPSEAYQIKVPRPVPERIASSPPDSPTRTRSYTAPMSGEDLRMLHDSGAITPPPTPTKISHTKSNSASSGYSLSSLRRGDSVSSTASRRRGPSIDENERPGSTELRRFPFWLSDYEIVDKKKPLGSGLWSDVYLAKPSLGRLSPFSEQPPVLDGPDMTPPITPIKARNDSVISGISSTPKAYAIKVPATKLSKEVLDAEAKVLSYLSRLPDAEKYLVPFFGQDTRTSALVLKAMDTTLEDWIHNTLNTLPEPERAEKLAAIFPSLASTLISGLQWLHHHSCTHADIKPSNILLARSLDISSVVFSDFSSATLSFEKDANPDAFGGGTWDFLDPTLVASAADRRPPNAASDTWALAVTLLYLVLGVSPYDCAGRNVLHRREYVKQGDPVSFIESGDNWERIKRSNGRVKALSKALGFDVLTWFRKVLTKNPARRVGAAEWDGEISALVGVAALRL